MNYKNEQAGNENDYCVAIIHTFPLNYKDFALLLNCNSNNYNNIYGDLGLFDIDQSRIITEQEFNKLFYIDSKERIFAKSVIMMIVIRSFITGNITVFKRIMAYAYQENINCTLEFSYADNKYIDYDVEDYNPALCSLLAYFENKFDKTNPQDIWNDEIFQYKKHICQAMNI